MARRLTSFSKLLITFFIVGFLSVGIFTIKTCANFGGGPSYEVGKKIEKDLEDQGYKKVTITGRCDWSDCGTSQDDRWNKTGYSVKAVSSNTNREVNGCACVHRWSGKISYNW